MEPITETITTTTETTASPNGRTTVETVEREYTPALGHHCTCEECQEWEEDVAHEIATLRERLLNIMESREMEHSTSQLSDSMSTDEKPAPEPKETETQVKVTSDVKEADEKKDEPKEEKPTPRKSKRTAGVFW